MKLATVGDVSVQIRGVSYDKSVVRTQPSDGYLPLLRGGNIGDHGLIWSDLQYVPKSIVNSAQVLREGDIVLAASSGSLSAVGKAARFDRGTPTTFGAFCKALRPNESVDASYFGHYFRTTSYRSQVSRLAEGANINNLRKEHLEQLAFPVPPLNEQRRIAAILDKADDLRAKRRQALAHLDTLTQSIFHSTFASPSEDWRTVRLDDLCGLSSGITKGRKTTAEVLEEYPYLAVSNVQDRALDMSVVKRIAVSAQEAERYRLRQGDLLLTEGGDPDKLGRGTIWNDELPWCLHQNHVFRVRLKTTQADPVYLSWYLASPAAKSYFLRMAKQTTGIASINKSQLSATPVLLPPLELQQIFVKRVATVERLKEYHRKHLAELDALFASLQHRAFKGEL